MHADNLFFKGSSIQQVSLSTSSTEAGSTFCDTSSGHCSWNEDHQLPGCVWRMDDVKTFFHNDDTHSIILLEKFRFVGRRNLLGETDTPLSHSWNFNPKELDSETCGRAAGELYWESLDKVKQIGFGSMVQQALGIPTSELKSTIWEYKWLHTRLYSYFIRNMKKAELLLKVKGVCLHILAAEQTLTDANGQELEEIGADRFILYVLEDAHKCVQEGMFGELDLVPILSSLITGPLKIHLSKPASAKTVLQQLEVLEFRYKRYVDEEWKTPLDTCTRLIDDFQKLGPLGFAISLTHIQRALYSKLSFNSFKKDERTEEEEQALVNLNFYSNSITFLVSDCINCQIVCKRQWFLCAKELSSLRNFYGVDAVITGLTAIDRSELMKQNVDTLFNFKKEINSKMPCLLPPFHATKFAIIHKDLDLARKLIARSVEYSPGFGRKERHADQTAWKTFQLDRCVREASDSPTDISSFHGGSMNTHAFTNEQMLYNRSSVSETVESGHWLKHFRISSLKYWFHFPCTSS